DQFEEPFDFEHLNYQPGSGVGLTLRRSTYIRAVRDLSHAFGNPGFPTAQGASSYLPPGVPSSVLTRAPSDICAAPIVLNNFYDHLYNPDGHLPVITFCDGGNDDVKQGQFDGTKPQLDPVQPLLAVDVNGNGKRDAGEPVLQQGSEPFRDVGTDGKADADE